MPVKEKKFGRNIVRQTVAGGDFVSREDVRGTWPNTLTLRQEGSVPGYRLPQIGAIHAALSHWTRTERRATIVMPTGTGKTETMLSLLIEEQCKGLLVVVPTDPLREQISEKFVSLGLLKDPMKVLDETAHPPIVGILKSTFPSQADAVEFFEFCNVIVATASILSKLDDEKLAILIANISHVFIDEAHHAEARTWYSLRDKFKAKRIIQFTATPYRNDRLRSKGDIIYTYPLVKAQQEGYFKKIQFIPVYVYDVRNADKAIAEAAVSILRDDRKKYPHILLARVDSKARANAIAAIYEDFKEFKVAKIYSGIPGKNVLREEIIRKEYDVIVCVDMLGEGFDLPELKIAAFHDVKKSLPTTIQFVGRFTRTKYDQALGDAKIIVNLADLSVKGELDELYAQDRDWNELLPRFSEARTQEEVDFQKTVEGFGKIEDFVVSLFDLRPAMSTVVYKNHLNGWRVREFEKLWTAKKKFELVKMVANEEKKILVVITAEKTGQKWTEATELFNVTWTLNIIHWNEELNLLFIHSSDKSSLHDDIAGAIIGEPATIINGDEDGAIFRCLDGIHRYRMQNVGLKELIGKLRRFRMSVGTDIGETLSRAEITRATKSHVFGVGYEFGNATTLGCSYKGRIWSVIQNDIDTFLKWTANVGRKLINPNIDSEQVLRGAIVPRAVSERPEIFPLCVSWSSDIYSEMETRFTFVVDGVDYEFFNCDLVLIEPSDKGNIKFGLESKDKIIAEFEHEIFTVDAPREGNDFRIIQTSPKTPVLVKFGTKEQEISPFFYSHTPEIWFADGSVLEGVALAELREDMLPFDRAKIGSWDWTDIDLSIESQGIDPKVENSIQFRAIDLLKRGDFDVIYDDDFAQEMADVVTLKEHVDRIDVVLFHLKGNPKNKLSGSVSYMYEVCGQSQKSVNWRYKESTELIAHLLRRKEKSKDGKTCSRIAKGTEEQITRILQLARSRVPFKFKVVLIQPALTRDNATDNTLRVLGVTENYVKTLGVDFEVIGSEPPPKAV